MTVRVAANVTRPHWEGGRAGTKGLGVFGEVEEGRRLEGREAAKKKKATKKTKKRKKK